VSLEIEQGALMEIIRSLAVLHDTLLRDARHGPLGLVPTMGALHDGHLALVKAARADCRTVAASIFVNPRQFAANEDFARYPRDESRDLALLEQAGCDMVWLPDIGTMYPPGDATIIQVAGPARRWEGAARPGHFEGVATVVAKLFGQVRPDRAYFGEKDWQQIQVIRRVTIDLLLPVEIVAVPTSRAADGVALSSRNQYLDPAQRAAAPEIYQVLQSVRDRLRAGVPPALALDEGHARLVAAGFVLDYLALVDPETMEPVERMAGDARLGHARLIVAARLGGVRLLDNFLIITVS
jgi:pantoate--beta-alanine ligase